MRIALISDIHGNEVALKAVLNDITQVGADQVVCLGDVATLGPCPASVIDILQDLGCHCILGNHDAFLLDNTLIHAYTDIPVVIAAVDWCRDQLSMDALDFLRTFQPTIELSLESQTSLLLFHGSPRSYMENLLSTTTPDEVDQFLAGQTASVMAGGHTHIQMLRQHRGMLIVNAGSVGMPFKEFVGGQAPTLLNHAEYAMIEAINGSISVNLRRVSLDKLALRAMVRSTESPLRSMLLQQYG